MLSAAAVGEVVDTLVANDDTLLVVRYGSNPGRDVDLLLVSRSEPARERVELAGLDVLHLSMARTEELARLRDPLVTEPVLTGTSLGGDRASFERLWNLATSPEVDSDTVGHLLDESARLFRLARGQARLASRQSGAQDLNAWSIVNAAWAAAYWLLAGHFSRFTSAIRLEELRAADPRMSEILELAARAKHREATVDDPARALRCLNTMLTGRSAA